MNMAISAIISTLIAIFEFIFGYLPLYCIRVFVATYTKFNIFKVRKPEIKILWKNFSSGLH